MSSQVERLPLDLQLFREVRAAFGAVSTAGGDETAGTQHGLAQNVRQTSEMTEKRGLPTAFSMWKDGQLAH